MTEILPRAASGSSSQDRALRPSQMSSYQIINQSDKWLHMKKETSCESGGQKSRGTHHANVDLAEEESWEKKTRQRQLGID